jgi:hypothetical protein
MKRYCEFSIWNNKEERPATADEITKRITIIAVNEDSGECEVIAFKDYSILLKE